MSYITVDDIKIASPCDVPWSGMKGTQYVRECGECKQNIYNLSLLTRAEANDLIREKEGKLCVQLYQKLDGTVLTADCPKGLRAIKRQYLRARTKIIVATLALIGFLGFSVSSCHGPNEPFLVGIVPNPDTTHHK